MKDAAIETPLVRLSVHDAIGTRTLGEVLTGGKPINNELLLKLTQSRSIHFD